MPDYSGPGSSVGIATGYGLDGPGIESRVRSRPKPSDFSSWKNSQHAFLRRGSKIICPMLVTRKTTGQKGQNRQNGQKRSNMVQEKKKNPGGGEIFRTRPDRRWGPPILLYNGYRVFSGGKAAGAWC
jgi:hypothetical protein